MIRVSEFITVAHQGLATLPARGAAGAQTPSSWFDGDPMGTDTRIGADISSASRGLSVTQHAAQVLEHLCAEPAGRA